MPNLYNDIEGMFTYSSLYDEMIEKYPSGSCFVEIGCWFGKSSVYLLESLKEKNKSSIHVDFVDSWIGGEGEPERDLVLKNGFNYVYDQFFYNIHRANNTNFDVIREFSALAAKDFLDEVFDFIFIDAGHRGWQCYDDMAAWYPRLKAGGTMAGHDMDFPDVSASVKRFCLENNLSFRETGSPVQCWIIEK